MILKQMMQTEHDKIKSPNWREAAPVGYLQACRRIRTRDDREQIQQVTRARIEPETNIQRFGGAHFYRLLEMTSKSS